MLDTRFFCICCRFCIPFWRQLILCVIFLAYFVVATKYLQKVCGLMVGKNSLGGAKKLRKKNLVKFFFKPLCVRNLRTRENIPKNQGLILWIKNPCNWKKKLLKIQDWSLKKFSPIFLNSIFFIKNWSFGKIY